jgi:streptogramin lyase
MRRVTRLSFRTLVHCLPFCALAATAQTPTPTPTTTPTPAPTAAVLPATIVSYSIPNGGAYDSSNLVLDPDGTLWAASGGENVVAKLSPDGATVTRWPFAKDATPSSLLKDADGTFWITELGGFNIAHFDPRSGTLTEWPDIGRRPTALVRRADGKLWLPETGGALALFDPVASSYNYYRASGSFSLSYPWLDADGSLFACDFLSPAVFRFAADGSSAKRWELPLGSAPSKVIRGFDGAIWISLYALHQLARLDTETNEVKIYQLPFADLPYDLHSYRGRIVFTEQRNRYIGFLEPAGATPAQVVTVTPTDAAVISTTRASVQVVSTLTPTTAAVTPGAATPILGFGGAGLNYYPAGLGTSFALLVDEARGRIWFGTGTTLTTLLPPTSAAGDRFLPSAASIAGRFGARWKTEVVTWNRGLATSTPGTAQSVSYTERLLPDRWIAGFSPAGSATLAPGQLLSQPDALANEMSAPDTFGGLRLTPGANPDEIFGSGRVYLSREDGGTYGFSKSLVKSDRAIAAGESAFLFAPPDASGQRTNAGILVLESAAGTISVVDADGATRASAPFDFPAGYHTQASTIFEALGLPALPSARVVVSVASGKVFPFGTSIDNRTNDPIGLDVMKTPEQYQWVPEAARGAGPLGASARTTLQLYNRGSADVSVTFYFHPAAAPGAPPPAAQSGTVSVPAGRVLTLEDALGTIGVGSGVGSLDLVSSAPVFAFARVTASAAGGGGYGFGSAGRPASDAIAPGSRGVFVSVTQNAATRSDLSLECVSGNAATVAVKLADATGADAGTLTVAVPAYATVVVESVWTAVTNGGTDLGRLDVVPADGSGAVVATLLRQDRLTGDADAIVPFVMPK